MEIDDEKRFNANDTDIPFHIPWLEKYRPIEFKEVIGNEEAISRFAIFAQKGNIPNVILCGPPGVGKTSVIYAHKNPKLTKLCKSLVSMSEKNTILCLARTLLGVNYKEAVLELNASNERGIDVVRNRIKMFAQTKVTLPPNKHKIVVLDEADSMTEGAQQALRRTMEVYSNTTRFALACNTSEKIIEPIQSRCAVIRFTKLTDQQIASKTVDICKAENLKYEDEGIEAIVFTAQGDMRQAINNLQSTRDGFSTITSENVFKVCDEPHPLYIKDMLKNCLDSNIDEAYRIIANLYKLGYSPEDIITNIFRVTKNYAIPEYLKLEFIKEIGLTHMRITQGVNSLLQLSALVARLCKKAISAN